MSLFCCGWCIFRATLYPSRLVKPLACHQSGLEYQFLRENLMKAEIAHLDKKGELVLGKRASRRQKRGMAQTYVVTWKDAETQAETTLPITQYGLGRRVCHRCCRPLAAKLAYHAYPPVLSTNATGSIRLCSYGIMFIHVYTYLAIGSTI